MEFESFTITMHATAELVKTILTTTDLQGRMHSFEWINEGDLSEVFSQLPERVVQAVISRYEATLQ